ncbi:MAG TPA: sugar ABC transporter permease [Streptomyces sp.]|jgi:multiple sugar transport system permease protein|nr:sugar ABC transporter permease [Streptomyces sp.]
MRKLIPYLFLLPAVIAELVVHFIPIIAGIAMSFMKLGIATISDWTSAPFTGFSNYSAAVHVNTGVGQDLLHSFWVSILYTLLVVGLSWLFGFTASVLLQNVRRGRGTLRALFLVPYALPAFTAVMTWSFMLQRDNGLINQLLVNDTHLLDEAPFWLLGWHSFFSLVAASVWRNWPFAFLVIMSGLQTVPRDLYEAAAIDGAGLWRQLRAVTMPMLRPVNQVLLLVLFLWNFNDFNTPFVMFGKTPPAQADLISIDIYGNTFSNWQFGAGAAESVLMLLFLLLVTGVYLAVTSRRRDDAV